MNSITLLPELRARAGEQVVYQLWEGVDIYLAMRPILSYDDITLPAEATHPSPPRPQHSQSPPLKKRKKPNQKPSNQQWPNIQHWDDPGNADETMLYDDIGSNGDAELFALNDEGEIEDEESRELTYEEIWDDSALINAWNAATEEYEAHFFSSNLCIELMYNCLVGLPWTRQKLEEGTSEQVSFVCLSNIYFI
jgi:hypothetical protein